MSIVEVAVPMLGGRRMFHIDKGRRWSVVEHLMLDAVARQPSSAAVLSERSCLRPRVVIEAFIRLMRVGWVELSSTENGTVFSATALGKAQLGASELRSATTRDKRWMSFRCDQVYGGVLRGREPFIQRNLGTAPSPECKTRIFLERSLAYETEDMSAIFAALAGEDEVIVGIDPSSERPLAGHALIKVKDGEIEGLPTRASDELRDAIVRKAAEALPPDPNRPAPRVGPTATPFAQNIKREVMGLFEQRDLILDGSEHRAAVDKVLATATDLIVIHSTFISPEGWRDLLPKLTSAAARGAQIHVLWGQSDDQNNSSSSRTEATVFRSKVEQMGRAEQIVIHPFTTGSHAKLLFSDDGRGHWSCIVGSCNWLSTDFSSYESSINARDPVLVGELLAHLSAMANAHDGLWSQTAATFSALSRRIAAMPRGPGRTAKMRILLAPEHAELVLHARDNARKRILVTSHRLGIAAKPMVVVPALAAHRENQVECSLFYGRATGAHSNLDTAAQTRELARMGVTQRPVLRPRLHAKVLAWDDDALAVTSQNWLSADPADSAYRREIGIFVEQNKLADTFMRKFELARSV